MKRNGLAWSWTRVAINCFALALLIAAHAAVWKFCFVLAVLALSAGRAVAKTVAGGKR